MEEASAPSRPDWIPELGVVSLGVGKDMTVSTPIRQRTGILDARGVSWRRIAREVGVSRQTVRKYARLEDCSPEPPSRPAPVSKLDPFKRLVDQWPGGGPVHAPYSGVIRPGACTAGAGVRRLVPDRAAVRETLEAGAPTAG